MIDAYLADLDRRLHGCGRFKADLLDEARDGLHDAADAYRAGGWTGEEAERRAVADFGPAAVVARGYQAELGMLSGVRTLWKLVIGVPAMQVLWDYARILTFGDWTKLSTPTPGWYKVVAHASHGAVFVVPVIGVLALLGTRWLSRRLDGVRLSRFCGVLIAFAVGVNLASVGLLIGATGVVDVSRLFLSVPCVLLMLAWVALSVRLVVLARRSWGGYATIVA
ncbi:permease prefix domain 1-containing protein [Amycolatopsis sp. CA-128772]|uniref:permease prefix domain 1-containing protein n=1 Tax=Amycolatopsis sp. CA-128772 TaxID=2073159 RepID=UPI000CD24776|nr:permease prefix domain 1-containing protein [Amycolatopsis sp. CA-128772]